MPPKRGPPPAVRPRGKGASTDDAVSSRARSVSAPIEPSEAAAAAAAGGGFSGRSSEHDLTKGGAAAGGGGEEAGGTSTEGGVAIALYDYAAADEDEISFVEGDSLSSVCECGSEGWLKGKVDRTLKTGTFPATYIEMAALPQQMEDEEEGAAEEDGKANADANANAGEGVAGVEEAAATMAAGGAGSTTITPPPRPPAPTTSSSSPAAALTSIGEDCSGWLEKEGGMGFSKWKKRWFNLSASTRPVTSSTLPIHFVFRELENTDGVQSKGVGAPHQCLLKGSVHPISVLSVWSQATSFMLMCAHSDDSS